MAGTGLPMAQRPDLPRACGPYDISGGRHLQAEKVARPVLSMAGAEMDNGVWTIHLNTWQTVIGPDAHSIQAETEDFALALELSPCKPAVLHGDAGYSRKGEEPERASCYYSFTRLPPAAP
jgi:predicted secreted hydrolase